MPTTILDFIIGATLMNAMPHLVLGIWKGRMFSIFGFGNKQNIAYGSLCLIASISLYIYNHGLEKMLEDKIYCGALALLLIYFITGKFWYWLFNKR